MTILHTLHTSSVFDPLITREMVLVTRFSPERPKFTDRKIKGVRVYIRNIIKNTKQNKIAFLL